MRSVAMACALALAGCSDHVGYLSLSGLESSLVVVAQLRADHTLVEARIVTSPSDPSYFASGDGDSLHAFAIDRELVRDADGARLSEDAFASLVLRGSGDPRTTSCAACPVPADEPPFVLSPGSRCALAPFFAHRSSDPAPLDEATLESLRSKIHLERPGECTCPAPKTGLAEGHFGGCEVESIARPHRWQKLAISDDGAIAAAHRSMVLTATIGGRAVFHPIDNAFIEPPSLAGIGARRFLGIGRTLNSKSGLGEESFVRFDGDRVEVFDLLGEPGELANFALYDPARSSVLLLGASGSYGEARTWRCDEALRACTPAELARCGDGPSADLKNIANAVILPSGDIFTLTLDSHAYVLPAGSDRWECRTGDRGRIRVEGPVRQNPAGLRVDGWSSVLVAGDRVFACGNAQSRDQPNVFYSVVSSAKLGSGGSTWHDGDISIWLDTAAGRCHGLWRDDANDETVAFFFREETVDVPAFDAAGHFVAYRNGPGLSSSNRAPRFPDLTEPVALIAESPDRRSLILGGALGSLRVQRSGGPLIAIDAGAPKRPAFAFADEDRALIAGGVEPPVTWSGGCDASSLVPLAPLDRELTAAALLDDGRVAVLSRGGVAIYDRELGVIEEWPLALPELESAAAITGDEVVLLDVGGLVHTLSLSRRTVGLLRLESEPGVANTRDVFFAALSGGPGVGWISGGMSLARIRPGEDGRLRGELWWGPRIAAAARQSDETFQLDLWGAPAVLCGGRAVIFARALLGSNYLARTLVLEPGANRDYLARTLPGFGDQDRFGSSSFMDLADHLTASESPVLELAGGMVLRPDSELYYAPNPDVTSIVEVGDRVVITDRAGNRVFLRAP